MAKRLPRKAGLAAICALLCLGAVAALAHAEIEQKGNLRVFFSGNISPSKLPRQKQAPIGVIMGAKIRTTDGTEPPDLEQIILDINKHGRLDVSGLPVCRLSQIQNATPAGAKAACGDAEVGHGNVTSRVGLPGQGYFASNGPMTAFNGRYKGRPAILAHVNSTGTLAITYVMIFQIKKGKGAFGTRLVADVPAIASGNGYISAFDMSLRRVFRSHGKKRSYLTASCPLPKGVKHAGFPFARSAFVFADGREISSVLNRDCTARG